MEWGVDLQSEHERYLAEEHVGRPVIVTDYPAAIKAFYMYLNDDEKTVRAMDVLVPKVGEIIGGSQREHRVDVLRSRIVAADLDPDDYGWYPTCAATAAYPTPASAGLRARRPVHDRHEEHPRRDSVSAGSGLRRVLAADGSGQAAHTKSTPSRQPARSRKKRIRRRATMPATETTEGDASRRPDRVRGDDRGASDPRSEASRVDLDDALGTKVVTLQGAGELASRAAVAPEQIAPPTGEKAAREEVGLAGDEAVLPVAGIASGELSGVAPPSEEPPGNDAQGVCVP